ncbi:MAG: hypothetical protein KAX33_11215 [Candidatus Lokiarchaeota archaeon]|nr:hypothetical protein [Candidatus Lokiarchaeota archaeon]
MSEIEIYEETIRDFNSNKDILKNREWHGITFLDFYNILLHKKDKKKIRMLKNCALLFISLFKNLPPDDYNNIGLDYLVLSKQEQERTKKILNCY